MTSDEKKREIAISALNVQLNSINQSGCFKHVTGLTVASRPLPEHPDSVTVYAEISDNIKGSLLQEMARNTTYNTIAGCAPTGIPIPPEVGRMTEDGKLKIVFADYRELEKAAEKMAQLFANVGTKDGGQTLG